MNFQLFQTAVHLEENKSESSVRRWLSWILQEEKMENDGDVLQEAVVSKILPEREIEKEQGRNFTYS